MVLKYSLPDGIGRSGYLSQFDRFFCHYCFMIDDVISKNKNKLSLQIIFHRDKQSKDTPHEGHTSWQEIHQEDINSMDSYTHKNDITIVASASYDGEIYIWSHENG